MTILMKRNWKIMLAATLLLGAVCSCHRDRPTVPSADFTPFISAYTGGSVPSDASVRIVFSQDMDVVETGKPLEGKIFSFSPSLKGKTYWENSHTVVFVPDSGALKQGQRYKGRFKLSAFFNVPKKMRHFPFSFQVNNKEFALQLLPMEINAATPDYVTLRGRISFNEKVRRKDVEQMIRVKGTDCPLSLSEEPEADEYAFALADIPKSAKPQEIQLTIDGKKLGIKDKITENVTIPALHEFSYLYSELIPSPEYGIRLIFSEPLSTEQDMQGLVELKNYPHFVVQVRENVAEIFIEESASPDSLLLRIDKSLRNSSGKQLGKSTQLYVKTHPLSPQVALLNEGVILPDAENLKFSFKAVSLQAVDLEIIQIYQNNILSFLQTNRLNESDELRRAGRLIHKQKLWLNPSAATANAWHNYAVDLSGVIRQEPGAIYNIRLSFLQSYATAPFNRQATQSQAEQGLIPLKKAVTPEEEEKWDRVSYYLGYPTSYTDYSEYRWRDRENPYTPSYYMEDRTISTNLLSSNLGITVKANENGKYWVMVNDILTTNAIRGAEVTLYNLQLQKIADGKTDSKGTALLETTAKPFVAVVTKGKQCGYLRMVEGENNSYSRFDVSGEKLSNGLKGFLYGERGIWRPGDTLFLTLILEDKNHRLPENHPVSIELFNPQGQFFYRKVSTSSVNGFHTFAIPTPSDAPTGLWHAYASAGQATFHKTLRIETVKPNRLKIDLQFPDTLLDVRQSLTANLRAAWLTGLTAGYLPAQVELVLSGVKTGFKGYENYVFKNPIIGFYPQTIRVFDGKLSADGTAKMELRPLASDQLPGKIKAQFVSRVMETGGDASVVSKNVTLSPYATYVGIRSNLSENYPYIETNTNHRFDIVTVSGKGKLVNCTDLEYYVFKIDWSYWWENEEEALSSYINSTNTKVVKSGTLATQNGKAAITFSVPYPEWGKYLLFVRDTKGGHASGFLFNVDWPSWRGNPDSRNPSAVQMLSFSLDKKEYKVGDEALLTIPKLKTGTALVSIENGTEVLAMHRVRIQPEGTTNFRFKVTEAMSPNAYVQISVIQPHALTTDHFPIRMYGVEPFTVSNPQTMLNPEISCPSVVRPQTPFTVKVKEKGGHPMTYTLAIVDEGLLSLTNFKTPNPWVRFYAREALGIRTWDVYNNIVGAFAGKYARMFSVGGDESMELSPAKVNRFNPVVRCMGPYTLGKGATRSHSVKLPQYIGAVRVMVVAAQDGAYGAAEKTMAVRSPLMVLSSMPRVISVGESIELPVNVFVTEPSVKEVALSVQTSGNVRIKGASSQKIAFASTGDKMVRFQLETGMATGTGKITLTANGGGHQAKEVVEIEVRNPNPLLTETQTIIIDPHKTASLPVQAMPRGKENKVQLEVSRLPSLYVANAFDFLENYRHLCTEQLVSKALPLLLKDRFMPLTETEKKQLSAEIGQAIKNLYARQQSSGGFVYWPGGRQTDDWLTSYAGHFLILAKEKGYEVNPHVYNQWLSYQRKAAQHWQGTLKNPAGGTWKQSDLEQAYRLYTLALAGQAETGAMNRLKGQSKLSLQARWRLAAAYALAGRQKTAAELTGNAGRTIAAYTSDNSTYGSSLRDEAMILETMLLTGKEKDAFRQAQHLAAYLRNETAYNTHATAYALLALGQLYEKYSGKLDFEWSLNTAAPTSVKTAKASWFQLIPPQNAAAQLRVRNHGDGKIHASLYQRSRPLADTAAARMRNLSMQLAYTDLNGQAIQVDNLTQGTDFLLTVYVRNTHPTQACKHMALTCILPSGWEVVNDRYLTDNGAQTDRITYQDIRDDRVLTYFDLPKQGAIAIKLRLRAAYCGQFILPAVKCEAMYDPETYARTKAGKCKVSRP